MSSEALRAKIEKEFAVPPAALESSMLEKGGALYAAAQAHDLLGSHETRQALARALKALNIPSGSMTGHEYKVRCLQYQAAKYVKEKAAELRAEAEEAETAVVCLLEKFSLPGISDIDSVRKLIFLEPWIFRYRVTGSVEWEFMFDRETGSGVKISSGDRPERFGEAAVEFDEAEMKRERAAFPDPRKIDENGWPIWTDPSDEGDTSTPPRDQPGKSAG